MVIEEWQKRYIESGLFSYHKIMDSTLLGDKMMIDAIDKAEKFFDRQTEGGDLKVAFIEEFYKKYPEYKGKRKKCVHHNVVCQSLGIEQAAGYVIRNEIVLRVALVASTLGLIRFE